MTITVLYLVLLLAIIAAVVAIAALPFITMAILFRKLPRGSRSAAFMQPGEPFLRRFENANR